MRGIGMDAVFVARLVTAEQRRRDALRESKVAERLGAGEGVGDDLRRLRGARIGGVGLEIVLAQIVGVGDASVDEVRLAGQRLQTGDLDASPQCQVAGD